MDILKNFIALATQFVAAVERIATAMEKSAAASGVLVSSVGYIQGEGLLPCIGQAVPGEQTGPADPAGTPSGQEQAEQPGDDTKRNRPTKEEMAQRRTAAIEAVKAAGLDLGDVEAQVKENSDKWTTRHCEKAMAMAAEKVPARTQVQATPSASTKAPPADHPNVVKIKELIVKVKEIMGEATGETTVAAIRNAFGAGAGTDLNAVPETVQAQIIASLQAMIPAQPPTEQTPVQQPAQPETPKSHVEDPEDTKVYTYIRSLVGSEPINTEADAEKIIKTMAELKPLSLEQVRAVAAASVNSKRISYGATINKIVCSRAGKEGVKLPDVAPELYTAIVYDIARQADLEAM